jgi:ankyrin repeat protein
VLQLETMRVLGLEYGADPNTPDNDGTPPLLAAVTRAMDDGYLETVRLLLAIGADPLQKNDRGTNALMLVRPEGQSGSAGQGGNATSG